MLAGNSLKICLGVISQISMTLVLLIIPFYISVGKPISVPKTDQPTQEQIDSMHEAYVQALKELYEEYNPIYGDPSINLNFI